MITFFLSILVILPHSIFYSGFLERIERIDHDRPLPGQIRPFPNKFSIQKGLSDQLYHLLLF
jgi:hypothetical protein